MTELSVIIPSYNRENTLPRAIDSVLNQTIEDMEIIIVNDGSEDDTYNVVKEYDDSRIRYIEHSDNKGQNVARNTGLRAAEGQYISYLDSDDILLPRHLEKAINVLEARSSKYAGVVTGYEDVVNGERIPQPGYAGKITYDDIVRDMYEKIGGLSLLTFKSDVLDVTGLHDENVINSTDLDFYFQILEEFDLVGIDEILCRRFKQHDSVSMNAELVIKGEEIILSKHGDKLTPENRAKRRFNRGIALAELGEMEQASNAFRDCIRDYPSGLLYYYHFLISLFGKSFFDSFALYPYLRDWHPEETSENV